MTRRGLKLLAETRFNAEQIAVNAETERERELAERVGRAANQLAGELDKRWHRRKEKVVERTMAPPQSSL